MAKPKSQAPASAAAETTPHVDPDPTGPAAASPPEADPQIPRPPQGIVIRHLNTGDPKKDLISKFKRPRIDPECLLVDGEHPYLALPIDGDLSKVRIRQVAAEHAADMLSCDPASGGTSVFRLATDREIAAYLDDQKKRLAALKIKPRE